MGGKSAMGEPDPEEDPKAIVSIGYLNFVMSIEDAVAVAMIVGRAERWGTKFHKDDKRPSPGYTTYHIWEHEGPEGQARFDVISPTHYRIAKLAGKPTDS